MILSEIGKRGHKEMYVISPKYIFIFKLKMLYSIKVFPKA